MTVPIRILCLLLGLLIAGPLSVPGWASVRTENRVWDFFESSLNSAPTEHAQPVELHQENPGCGYDFAPAVHKYLYCHANPINGTDPSGHEMTAPTMTSVTGVISATARVVLPSIGRAKVHSRNLIGRSMVQASRLRVGDPTEYLAGRGVGAVAVLATAAAGVGLGLAFEYDDETKGRILYRAMTGDAMPDLLPEGVTKASYLGIRENDLPTVVDGMVQPDASNGLSVTPSDYSLMHPLILRKYLEGKADMWGIYEGIIDSRLMVRPDPKNLKGHAFIGVANPMPVHLYRSLIKDTQRQWSKVAR